MISFSGISEEAMSAARTLNHKFDCLIKLQTHPQSSSAHFNGHGYKPASFLLSHLLLISVSPNGSTMVSLTYTYVYQTFMLTLAINIVLPLW